MEDLFAGSIPSQLSAAPVEKEFTVSEISFEIKKFVESNFNRVTSKVRFSAANGLIPVIGTCR